MRAATEDALLAAWGATLAGAKEKPALFNTRRKVLRMFPQIEERSRQLGRLLMDFEAGEVAAVPGGTAPEVMPLRRAASTAKNDWGGRPPSLLKLTSGTTAAPRAIRFR